MQKIKIWSDKIIQNVEKVFLGKREIIEKTIAALLSGGHALVEDVPGTGKTILARALAKSVNGDFKRIQCTPDLLPADILGVSIFNPQKGSFEFRNGPIMSNFLLVDEINRATPRTQSALLEAMAERQISVEGRQLPLPDPFFIMATENPVEYEGTFPLPEAQKDRFLMTLKIGYPEREVENQIIQSQRQAEHPINSISPVVECSEISEFRAQITELHVDPEVADYILDIVQAARENPRLRLGVSTRGALALYRAGQALAAVRGRDYVQPEDIKELALSALVKRIIVSSESLVKGITAETVIEEILDRISVPLLRDRM